MIPKENEKDLADIPDNVKEGLEIIPVSVVDEVITHALISQPVPVNLEEANADSPIREADNVNREEVVKH